MRERERKIEGERETETETETERWVLVNRPVIGLQRKIFMVVLKQHVGWM